jgi:hypothetical protein
MRQIVFATLAFTACSTSTGDSDSTGGIEPLAPPPAGEGFQLEMEFTAPALTEVWMCNVYTIPITEPAAVNQVEYQQNFGTHHMSISTMGLVGGQIEPGQYDCNDLYADPEFMENQIMIFGGQGDADGEINLPEGVVANLPVGIDIIHEVHYVNYASEDVELYSRVNAWTIPQNQVTDGIWGGSVRDYNIEIPPQSEHVEWTRCLMNEDVDVLFLASHMHKTGFHYTIAPFDGTTVGEVMYTNDDWHSPKVVQFDTPMRVEKGKGFEFACHYRNETDAPIRYGLTADDEMCTMTLVHTPMSITAKCEIVAASNALTAE